MAKFGKIAENLENSKIFSKMQKKLKFTQKIIILLNLSLFWLIIWISKSIWGFSVSLGWFEVDMKIVQLLPIYKGKHMEPRGVPLGNSLWILKSWSKSHNFLGKRVK